METQRPYVTLIQAFYQNGELPTDCGGFVISNTGNATAFINTLPVFPGGSYSPVPANANEIERSVFKLVFGPGTNPQIFLSRKMYI